MAVHIPVAVLPVLLALPLTVPIAVIDLRRHIIPNALNGGLLLVGLVMLAATQDPAAMPGVVGMALVEAACAYLLLGAVRAAYGRLRGRTGLGAGDVKFVAAAMPWIGLAQLPLMILIASTTALLVVVASHLSGRPVGARTRLPFGPFLALGLHGAQLIRTGLPGLDL